MTKHKPLAAVALMSLGFLGWSQTITGGTAIGKLTGKVVDDVDESPISGASIQAADAAGHVVATKTSDFDGSYKMDGLPLNAKFKVTYQKQGYMPDQYDLTVTAQQNGRLLNLRGTQKYYERKASKMKAELALTSGPQQEHAWQAQWTRIANSPLPPAAKGSIARALQSSAPQTLQKSELFTAYAKADPGVLDKLNVLMTAQETKHDWLADFHVSHDILTNIQVTKALAGSEFKQ